MGSTFAAILVSVLAVTAAILACIYLLVPAFKGVAWLIVNVFKGIGAVVSHIFRFIFGMIGDVVRAIGAVLTALLFTPLVVLNVIIGRWSAAAHLGRALKDEIRTCGHCIYRVVIGHPARLLFLHGLTEGIEKRIPEALAHSPGSDRPSHRTGQFDGYTIVGSLPGGGSGGRLYVAEPTDRKRAALQRDGAVVDQVVIKAFSLHDGSSLPQIIRESRALESARKLGLVLDHELTDERFYYVMEFVPGDSLTVVTKRLHSEASPEGFAKKQLVPALTHVTDLLRELAVYHRGGLWHKDVKPDNIIVSAGRTRLVDLGLVTPLRSAMTLTTHGTEYFRDPELVRMALRGAKVRDVDGVKFDIYGVGAVLFSVIENSFPGHGGLSQITKRCPEALRWVVRRSMADLQKRYISAEEMLADVAAVLSAEDPFAMKPADLPSVRGGVAAHEAMAAAIGAPEEDFDGEFSPAQPYVSPAAARVGSPNPGADKARHFDKQPAAAPEEAAPRGRKRPSLLVTDWLTGRYVARGSHVEQSSMPTPEPHKGGPKVAHAGMPMPPRGQRASANDQILRAHERVRRAQDRISRRAPKRAERYDNKPNAGVMFASFLTIAVIGAVTMIIIANQDSSSKRSRISMQHDDGLSRVVITTDRGAVEIPVQTHESGQGLRLSDAQLDSLKQIGARVETALRDGVDAAAARIQRASLTHSDPSGTAHASGAMAPKGSVLLLSMLPSDIASKETGSLQSLTAGLRAGGFLVRGTGSSAEETDLLAAGKRVVELSTPDDREAVERVRQWLSTEESGVDAALWIGQGTERGSVIRRLVVRDGFDSEAVLLAMPGR